MVTIIVLLAIAHATLMDPLVVTGLGVLGAKQNASRIPEGGEGIRLAACVDVRLRRDQLRLPEQVLEVQARDLHQLRGSSC